MRYLLICFFAFVSIVVSAQSYADSNSPETIIIIRHGEKPAAGLGQLTCQGLNRALLLPYFFKKNFPDANYIYAPNPGNMVSESDDNGAQYYYVRPLTTIEPTAISLQLPVNTKFGYRNIQGLSSELLLSKYHHATIYVVWEHMHIMKLSSLLLKTFHKRILLPNWDDHDYNKVFVFKIDWTQKPAVLSFSSTTEGFRDIRKTCPTGN